MVIKILRMRGHIRHLSVDIAKFCSSLREVTESLRPDSRSLPFARCFASLALLKGKGSFLLRPFYLVHYLDHARTTWLAKLTEVSSPRSARSCRWGRPPDHRVVASIGATGHTQF